MLCMRESRRKTKIIAKTPSKSCANFFGCLESSARTADSRALNPANRQCPRFEPRELVARRQVGAGGARASARRCARGRAYGVGARFARRAYGVAVQGERAEVCARRWPPEGVGTRPPGMRYFAAARAFFAAAMISLGDSNSLNPALPLATMRSSGKTIRPMFSTYA